ncbi:hypothetical protein LJR234_006013 [Mesorhizobium amorphae]|uniref:hypothetical protein n=1 Tax=Mesorhizobium amorphae TaxID=71433 RepID=UPI003ECFED8F
MALAIHELTTNAIKYGALSNAKGNASMAWKFASRKCHRRLELDCHEKNGAIVGPVERKGLAPNCWSVYSPPIPLIELCSHSKNQGSSAISR